MHSLTSALSYLIALFELHRLQSIKQDGKMITEWWAGNLKDEVVTCFKVLFWYLKI
jgi:hypothetical protein